MASLASDHLAPATDRSPSDRYLQKREQILDAACRKFNMLGVRGATLEDIARDVGMNLTSIRHYFRRKDDLVAAGFLRSIDVHAQQFTPALEAGDPPARVRALVKIYFALRRAIREGRGPEVMIFGDLRSLDKEHASEVWPRYIELFQLVRRIVTTPEELAADRARANVRTYYVMSQLFRSVYWMPAFPVDLLDWVEEKFTDILFHGLKRDPAAANVRLPSQPDYVEGSHGAWESFLLAATRLINEQGYRGASVDAIARKLNRTKGSFYHHVEGKGDLLAACFNRSLGVLRDAQRQAVETQTSGLDRAQAACIALVRRQQTDAGPLLRSSALMSAEADKRDKMFRDLAGVVMHFSGMITDGIIDGSVRACDARVAAEMIMVTVNSAAQIRNWAKEPTPDFAEANYARPVFEGLYP